MAGFNNVLSGIGSAPPQPRVLSGTMFGAVPDAFDGKSLKIGELSPRSRRRKEMKEGVRTPDSTFSDQASESSSPVVEEKSEPTKTLDDIYGHPWADDEKDKKVSTFVINSCITRLRFIICR